MHDVRRRSDGTLLGPRTETRSYDEIQLGGGAMSQVMERAAPVKYYEEAGITIWHGDCRDVLPDLWAGSSIDHMITDPPYSEHTHAKQWIGAALTADGKVRVSTAHKGLGFEALSAELQLFICAEAARLVRRWVLAFSDVESIGQWQQAVRVVGLDYVRALIWDKVDGAPQFTGDRPAAGAEAIVAAHTQGKKRWNGGGGRNVLRHAVNGDRGAKPHPSTKPEPLMAELVSLFTDPGDLILDPFGGSGTTAVAAKRLGRRCILIEREEKYCEIAAKRLSQGALDLFGVGATVDAIDPHV
jgi:DNA modification methylase